MPKKENPQIYRHQKPKNWIFSAQKNEKTIWKVANTENHKVPLFILTDSSAISYRRALWVKMFRLFFVFGIRVRENFCVLFERVISQRTPWFHNFCLHGSFSLKKNFSRVMEKRQNQTDVLHKLDTVKMVGKTSHK